MANTKDIDDKTGLLILEALRELKIEQEMYEVVDEISMEIELLKLKIETGLRTK